MAISATVSISLRAIFGEWLEAEPPQWIVNQKAVQSFGVLGLDTFILYYICCQHLGKLRYQTGTSSFFDGYTHRYIYIYIFIYNCKWPLSITFNSFVKLPEGILIYFRTVLDTWPNGRQSKPRLQMIDIPGSLVAFFLCLWRQLPGRLSRTLDPSICIRVLYASMHINIIYTYIYINKFTEHDQWLLCLHSGKQADVANTNRDISWPSIILRELVWRA